MSSYNSKLHIFENIKNNTNTNLDSYINIYFELNNPFHLCLHLDDFLSQSRYVKTIVYSIGRDPEIIWGVYDKSNNNFVWNDSCNYSKLHIISNLLKILRTHKFTLVSNAVRDRINSTLNEFMGIQSLKHSQYRILKYLKAYLDRLISFQSLSTNIDLAEIPEILEFLQIPILSDDLFDEYGYELSSIKNDYRYLNEYYTVISEKIQNYESTLNRVDLDRDSDVYSYISPTELQSIVNAFLNSVQTKKYKKDYEPVQCVLQTECNRSENPSCELYLFIAGLETEFL